MGLLHDRPPRLRPAELAAGGDFGARLVQALQAADLRGRGGAGFPTATKIAAALRSRPTVIVNVCDGEPLVSKDATLVARSPGLLLDGVALLQRALEAPRVVFAAHRGSATERLLRLRLHEEPQLVPHAEVLAVPARYVSSEESSLASLSRGGEARPRFRTQPLTSGGVDGAPVLVLNAETCAQVALVWSGRWADTRLVTASGAVAYPGVHEVTDSFRLVDLVPVGSNPRAVLVGGYGGTWVSWEQARRHSLASLAADGVPLGAGLLHVLGPACPITEVGAILGYLAGESAGQCGPCMFGLPAIAADWAELAQPHRADAALDRLRRRLPVITGRGACRHPDGTVRMAASALAVFDAHLVQHRWGRCAGLDGAGLDAVGLDAVGFDAAGFDAVGLAGAGQAGVR